MRYTEKEYAIVGKVLADMATARIHSIKPTKNSIKTTKKEKDGSTITHDSRSL